MLGAAGLVARLSAAPVSGVFLFGHEVYRSADVLAGPAW